MAGAHLVVAAAAFGLGCLLGPNVPAGAAGWLATAGALGAASIAPPLVRAARSPALLQGVGLRAPEPTGPRERILAAAGILAPEPVSRPVPALNVALVAASLAVAGVGWAGVRSASPPGAELLEGSVEAVATIASDPRSAGFGWSAEATARELTTSRGRFAARLRVVLAGSGRAPQIEPGDLVALRGRAAPLEGGGYASFLRSRGVVGEISLRHLVTVHRASGPLALANAVRRALRRGAERVLAPREAGLLLGLAIGDTRTLDPAVEEDFRATGMTHLLAVSGSNVAMVVAPVLAVAIAAGLRLRGRVLAGLGTVVFFALVTRWEPSVLRAGAMATLTLLAVASGRPRATASILGAAVLLLLVADPGLARSVGFQLSVAATAGIATFAGPLADRCRRVPRAVALAVGVTLGAQLGVTPLLVLRFGEVPVVTLLANVVAAPLVPFALAGGLIAAALGLLAPGVGVATAGLLSWPIVALLGTADVAAKLGLPWVGGGAGIAALLGVLVVGCAWALRRGRVSGRPVAIAVGTLLLASGAAAGPPDSLTVTFLDVGQGDAALVRTPEGATVLIDAGPEERAVASALSRLGVRRIDLAIASHAHADHIEGFPAVFARFRIGLVLEPGCASESPSYADFRRAIAAESLPVRPARGGRSVGLGSLVVELLGPDRCGSTGPNDDSVVARLRYGPATILFPGDAEVAAQRDLLRDGDRVTAGVLKVPHHGGATSLDAFIAATRARIAVISAGADNEYGHPAPELLAMLRAAGMTWVRTDLRGDVTISFDGADPHVRSAR